MKLLILYRPESEHSLALERFKEDFRNVYPDIELEMIDVDSVEGINTAGLYDILQYPSLIIIGNDGALIKDWIGDNLPPIENVAGYFLSS